MKETVTISRSSYDELSQAKKGFDLIRQGQPIFQFTIQGWSGDYEVYVYGSDSMNAHFEKLNWQIKTEMDRLHSERREFYLEKNKKDTRTLWQRIMNK